MPDNENDAKAGRPTAAAERALAWVIVVAIAAVVVLGVIAAAKAVL